MKSNKGILIAILLIVSVFIIIAFVNKNARDRQNEKHTQTLNKYLDSSYKPTETKVTYTQTYWTIDSFVDDFGDATKDKFVRTLTEGTFSNSATRNSFLGVKILITKKNMGLFMHEYNYGRSPESFIGDGTIMMKNSDGEVIKGYTGSKWNNTGGIKISGNTYTKIKNFLMKSKGEIRVNVKDDYSSTYDFTINADGFAERFKEL